MSRKKRPGRAPEYRRPAKNIVAASHFAKPSLWSWAIRWRSEAMWPMTVAADALQARACRRQRKPAPVSRRESGCAIACKADLQERRPLLPQATGSIALRPSSVVRSAMTSNRTGTEETSAPGSSPKPRTFSGKSAREGTLGVKHGIRFPPILAEGELGLSLQQERDRPHQPYVYPTERRDPPSA